MLYVAIKPEIPCQSMEISTMANAPATLAPLNIFASVMETIPQSPALAGGYLTKCPLSPVRPFVLSVVKHIHYYCPIQSIQYSLNLT